MQTRIETAGPPKQIKLTPIVGPGGWQADGQDIALVDVEVVDAEGRRCPTDDARIDLEIRGPAIWRGGYNSGKVRSTNNLYLNTECGINRVAMRSTRAGNGRHQSRSRRIGTGGNYARKQASQNRGRIVRNQRSPLVAAELAVAADEHGCTVGTRRSAD